MSMQKLYDLCASEYGMKFDGLRMDTWENGLSSFPDQVIERAIYAHLSDPGEGRFKPSLAGIIGRCTALARVPGWPSADEAWALAPKSEDDSAMLIQEVAEALATSRECGTDRVAARMAFKGTYERLVEQAKVEGRVPKFFYSPGRDAMGRVDCLVKAVAKGLMKPEAIPALLPPAQVEQVLISAGVPKTHPLLAPPATPENRKRARALLLTLKPRAMGKVS